MRTARSSVARPLVIIAAVAVAVITLLSLVHFTGAMTGSTTINHAPFSAFVWTLLTGIAGITLAAVLVTLIQAFVRR